MDQPDQVTSISFPQERIVRLLLDLKVSLGQAEGQPLSYAEWGRMTNRPPNTIASWSAGGAAHQLEVLLGSLERLGEGERHRLIDTACREFPTLHHRRLSHDFVACSHLATLLRQPSGLTFIQGAPEYLRTFLLHALGHSAASPDFKRATVVGVDIHRPDAFVPVIGLIYLGNLLRAADIEQRFKRLWPGILGARARLLLLNGVWRSARDLQPEILDAARQSHVVVADALNLQPNELVNRVPAPTHIITVSPARENVAWVRIEIQAV